VKLASMVNQHTRKSLLDITDRSMTAVEVIDHMNMTMQLKYRKVTRSPATQQILQSTS
jgi:hypothetical protein